MEEPAAETAAREDGAHHDSVSNENGELPQGVSSDLTHNAGDDQTSDQTSYQTSSSRNDQSCDQTNGLGSGLSGDATSDLSSDPTNIQTSDLTVDQPESRLVVLSAIFPLVHLLVPWRRLALNQVP